MGQMRTVFAAAGVTLLLAGCSSPSRPAAALAAAPTTHPGLGIPQIMDFSGGTGVMVVLKVVDPAQPTRGSEAPGVRDVAALVRIASAKGTFASGPMYTLQGFDADGQRLEEHVDWPTSAGPELNPLAGVTIAAGDIGQGFVTFEVPTGAKLARVQYTPPGGAMVEWTIG